MSSLIDAGRTEGELFLEELDLNQFMKQIVDGMRSQFQKKKIVFKLVAPDRILLRTDKYRLGQSIYNVLTNAYKFTLSGGIVMVHFYRENDIIKIEIEDTGCGIKEEEQTKIFDAYYRSNTKIEHSGDGIGLFVAKENMESLKGRIEVQSKEGVGSKFILVLPFDTHL